MSKPIPLSSVTRNLLAAIAVNALLLCAPAYGQNLQLPPELAAQAQQAQQAQAQQSAGPQTSLPNTESLVTDESEISLSADTINGILKKEPGLLLQVKRMLAKKAAEQGRVLYVNELTDETTYRLIEE